MNSFGFNSLRVVWRIFFVFGKDTGKRDNPVQSTFFCSRSVVCSMLTRMFVKLSFMMLEW